jgi:hypothetical protein
MLIRVLFLGACYTSTSAFTTPTLTTRSSSSLKNSYLDSINSDGNQPSSSKNNADESPPPVRQQEQPPAIDLGGQIVDRQSNLVFRGSQSVNDDPRPFDVESRSVSLFHLFICQCGAMLLDLQMLRLAHVKLCKVLFHCIYYLSLWKITMMINKLLHRDLDANIYQFEWY